LELKHFTEALYGCPTVTFYRGILSGLAVIFVHHFSEARNERTDLASTLTSVVLALKFILVIVFISSCNVRICFDFVFVFHLVLVLVLPLLVLVLNTITKITRTVPHLRILPEVCSA